jgi:hypothetical protein
MPRGAQSRKKDYRKINSLQSEANDGQTILVE